jgi:hypothetical protein
MSALVEILKDDKRLGVKRGEVYWAEPYSLDPSEKWTLLERVPDGYQPHCNLYRSEVRRVRHAHIGDRVMRGFYD